MSDWLDQAADITTREREASIARARAAATANPQDRLYCSDCDVQIPEARRRAIPSACRCAPCQERVDLARRRR